MARLLPILLFALYFGYYYFSNQTSVPLTGRTQLVDISRQEEMQLGINAYHQILRESKVITQGRLVDQVNAVGQRIAKAAAEHDPGFKWQFSVIESPQANAFALPGGKVAVYTGLVPVVANTDGLAVVMGHEVAHAIARHGAERMAHQKLVKFGTMAASVALGGSGDYNSQRMIMGALGAGSRYGVLLPFSRKHESEADYMGLMYLAKACFDPREAPKVWQRMAGNNKGKSPSEFASTHPSNKTRIRQFKEWMPEALAVRDKYCSGE